MKIELLYSSEIELLQDKINAFIEGKDVIRTDIVATNHAFLCKIEYKESIEPCCSNCKYASTPSEYEPCISCKNLGNWRDAYDHN